MVEKRRLVLLFVVMILAVIIEITITTHCSKQNAAQTEETAQIEDTDESMEEEEATPMPTDTPEPSPTPTPFYGTAVAQGHFSSSTGTSLNLNIAWTSFDLGDGNAVIAITGTVNSYALDVEELEDSVTIEFAGYSATCDSDSVVVTDNVYKVNQLFYVTLTVPMGTVGEMSVYWDFGGAYDDVQLDTITARGRVDTEG